MLMPLLELTESDLKAYLDKLSKPSLFSNESLGQLSLMYSRFRMNELGRINLEYDADSRRVEQDYIEEKKRCQYKLDELKRQYKQIDNRIISVEQKLSRGIPEDLALIDKLIAEQEAIVQEQEYLNAAKSALKAQVTNVDITYGKTCEKLSQNRIAREMPIPSRFEQYAMGIKKADQKIRIKTSLFALILIIGVPLMLEFVAYKTKIPITTTGAVVHGVLVHYLFLVALILTELFLAERIRNKIYAFFGIRYAVTSGNALLKLLSENLDAISKLKKSAVETQQTDEVMEQLNH
ncbi:hypothetical protein [Pedobacter sp. V48]|uniref:hypothetical protein n=1 Tax=Pedobacter sp. V48 TaxID=509635 RepID=UPI0003E5114F|nr:hypothetical protein [Pedobacter sp. V48]ETZ23099.1 hypothetical protein N824_20905 [Pedobacter sp. V48]